MEKLSPESAAGALKANTVSGPIRVDGKIDLKDYPHETLPDGISCYELDLTNSKLTSLPNDLHVDGRIVLDNSRHLESLPEDFSAGSISLRFCPSLLTLPEGIDTWFLDLTGCERLESWPNQGSIQRGSLILRNCIGLQALPEWLGVLAHLDIAGCVQLSTLPKSLKVSSWLDLGGTGLTSLPDNLAGVPLRWRSVPINERIAFRPEELTAKEAIAETNAEVRRVMIERMGYLEFARDAGAKVLDSDEDPGGKRELLFINLQEDEPLVGLSCSCPSTGRKYLLRVPPKTKTCHAAAAWIAGFDNPKLYHPLIET